MNVAHDWRLVVRKAWSFRLLVLAGVLSSIEVLLPLWSDSIPRGVFAVMTMMVVIAAGVARVVAQKDFDGSQ